MAEAYIVDAARTPTGRRRGSLAQVHAAVTCPAFVRRRDEILMTAAGPDAGAVDHLARQVHLDEVRTA